jgi:hypothetical protein
MSQNEAHDESKGHVNQTTDFLNAQRSTTGDLPLRALAICNGAILINKLSCFHNCELRILLNRVFWVDVTEEFRIVLR